MNRMRSQSNNAASRAAVLLTALCALWAAAHEGIVAGHSPPDPNMPPPCPTSRPLQLFALPEPRVGSPLAPGEFVPESPGAVTAMARVGLTALLARPEFGGFVYVEDTPGLDYVEPANPCHALTTAFTGGQPFVLRLDRRYWPDGLNFSAADPFGALVLLEEGDSWTYADQSLVHIHPLWLVRRPGAYHVNFGLSSDKFLPSDPFSISFVTNPECWRARPIDMSPVFNADVVDSDAGDVPTPFDPNGRTWLLDGHHGTQRGLPVDGRLDVFQMGGPAAAGLHGAALNCLFDNGALSTAATLDLLASGQAGSYQSIELLVGGAGAFTSSHTLVVRMNYASGAQQVVNIRRAASSPRFTPLADWRATTDPPPTLAVGRSGVRWGGGFERSTGAGVDTSIAPADSMYFQRVTFPVDPARELRSIVFDNYTGAGRVGVFAMTAIRAAACPNGDYDEDLDVDAADFLALAGCMDGPGSAVAAGSACQAFDLGRDRDVDVADFADFQVQFGAPL